MQSPLPYSTATVMHIHWQVASRKSCLIKRTINALIKCMINVPMKSNSRHQCCTNALQDYGLDLGIPGTSFWRGMRSRDGTAKLFAERLDMPYDQLKETAGPKSTLTQLLLALEDEGLVTESTSSTYVNASDSKCGFSARGVQNPPFIESC
jgi:hypothetical protein